MTGLVPPPGHTKMLIELNADSACCDAFLEGDRCIGGEAAAEEHGFMETGVLP